MMLRRERAIALQRLCPFRGSKRCFRVCWLCGVVGFCIFAGVNVFFFSDDTSYIYLWPLGASQIGGGGAG